MINSLLPCGTVVLLENKKEKVMIVSHKSFLGNEEGGVALFDYAGIVLPQGYKGEDDMIFFDASGIKEVLYEGYKDESIIDYLEDIKWVEEKFKNE